MHPIRSTARRPPLVIEGLARGGARGGGGLAASLLRRPVPRAGPARRAPRGGSCPDAHVSLSASSWGHSASTSGRRPPSSTPPSPRCSPPTSGGLGDRGTRELGCRRAPDHAVLGRAHRLGPRRRPRRAHRPLRSGRRGRRGAARWPSSRGSREVLCFDMGGTSCDVCLIDDDQVPETAERVIAGRPLALPALDIHTVGAGGGSIAWRDPGGALRVGPASAGAEPGPGLLRTRRRRSRRSPTPTCCSDACSRMLPSPAPSRSTATPPSARSRELAGRARPRHRSPAPRGSCGSPRRRCWARCA